MNNEPNNNMMNPIPNYNPNPNEAPTPSVEPQNTTTVNHEVSAPVYEEASPQFQEVVVNKLPQRTDSDFDGGLLELIGWRLLGALITGITLGIGLSWAQCMIYNYEYSHTVYNGKRLKFEGTGGDLFVNRFKWIFFSIITFGIYLFIMPVRKQQWITAHLHFEDENLIKGESYFDGKTIQLIGVNILCNILNALSLGLLFPFTVCYRLKWINKHTIINRKKLAFTGKALNLFGKYLLWVFLTLITFGIYGWWLRIKMLKWETKNIHIKTVGEAEIEDNKALAVAIGVGVLGLLIFILVVPKLFALIPNIDNFNISNPFKASESTNNGTVRINPAEREYRNYP